MKRVIPAVGLFLLVALVSVTAAVAGDGPGGTGWFDFDNCEFCKGLTAEPGLMENTTWENHAIADGMMNIMTIKPGYEAAMARAEAHMQKLGGDIQSGKVNPMTLKMCGHCQSFGMLMMSGVKVEAVRGDAAIVTLYTSDDPGLVARLHQQVKRDNEEMAAMTPQH